MPVGAGHLSGRDEIAVREQHRRLGLVGFDPGGEHRHHVRPIGEIGDAAEAFGLALGAIGPGRTIETHKLRVGGRVHHGLDVETERPLRGVRNGQQVGGDDIAIGRQGHAVERQRDQRKAVAVESERCARFAGRVRLDDQSRAHTGCDRVERDVERDSVDHPVRRTVILEADGLGRVGAHGTL